MTAPTPPAWAAPNEGPRRSWGAGRIVALVLGILLLVPGLALLGGGGTLLSADWTGRDDGFLFSPEEDFISPGHALVSERIELRTDADWLPVSSALGTAQVEITGVGQDEVFVGIAPVADASAYLGSVQRTVIDDLGFDTPADNGDQVAGGAPTGPPTDQDFWTTQSSGPGTQQLTWEPAQGDWMLVVMNADGSAGVQVQGRIGAEFPALTGFAWGILIGGLLLTAIAVLLLVLAVRTPRDRRPPTPYPAGAVPFPRGPGSQEFWGPVPARSPQDEAAPAPAAGTPGREPGNRGV